MIEQSIDVTTARPEAVVAYFGSDEVQDNLIYGVEHLSAALLLIKSDETKTREAGIGELLNDWHMTDEFVNMVRAWGRWEDFDECPLCGGRVVDFLRELTENGRDSFVSCFWSEGETSLVRDARNSARVLDLIGQLHRQLRIEWYSYSMQETAKRAGFLFAKQSRGIHVLEPALDFRTVQFEVLGRLLKELEPMVSELR